MTDLFSVSDLETPQNLLPRDGTVNYYGVIFSANQLTRLTSILMAEIPWANDEVMMFGKKIVTRRKMAWFADDGLSYTYSGSRKQAHSWTPTLLDIKTRISEISGHSYNSCLLNLYHNGAEAMGWHADDEKELLRNGAIASVSFGATRKFLFKHRMTAEKVDIILENGSLLVMKDETQYHWLHRLPPSKRVLAPRINLTFRTVNPS
jgi:alkylated DNA repair dioxygenase AlkB